MVIIDRCGFGASSICSWLSAGLELRLHWLPCWRWKV